MRFGVFNTSSWTPDRGGDSSEHFHAKLDIRMLRENLGKAMMINEALWELMRDKLGLTEQDLYDKLYEVDMRDGTLDGQNQRKVIKCPECNRPVSDRNAACLYCGHIIDESVFRIT